jgi:hypothetical protein
MDVLVEDGDPPVADVDKVPKRVDASRIEGWQLQGVERRPLSAQHGVAAYLDCDWFVSKTTGCSLPEMLYSRGARLPIHRGADPKCPTFLPLNLQ